MVWIQNATHKLKYWGVGCQLMGFCKVIGSWGSGWRREVVRSRRQGLVRGSRPECGPWKKTYVFLAFLLLFLLSVCHMLLVMTSASSQPRNNRHKWPWTETSEPSSQINLHFFNFLSGICHSATKQNNNNNKNPTNVPSFGTFWLPL
jgi:hypothetical protein